MPELIPATSEFLHTVASYTQARTCLSFLVFLCPFFSSVWTPCSFFVIHFVFSSSSGTPYSFHTISTSCPFIWTLLVSKSVLSSSACPVFPTCLFPGETSTLVSPPVCTQPHTHHQSPLHICYAPVATGSRTSSVIASSCSSLVTAKATPVRMDATLAAHVTEDATPVAPVRQPHKVLLCSWGHHHNCSPSWEYDRDCFCSRGHQGGSLGSWGHQGGLSSSGGHLGGLFYSWGCCKDRVHSWVCCRGRASSWGYQQGPRAVVAPVPGVVLKAF